MAHMISKVGGKANLVYTGLTPWHGLGTRISRPMTWEEAYKLASLDWTVSLEPSGYMNKVGKFVPATVISGVDQGIPRIVTEKFHVIRSDNGEIIGTVGKGYKPVQNRDCFSILNAVVKEQLATIEVAGALKQGQIIWVLAKLPGYIRVKGDDTVDKFLLLANGHDGLMKFTMQLTPTRVVCNNTLNVALREATARFTARHTGEIGMKISAIRDTLGIVNEWFEKDFAAMAQKLVAKQVTTLTLDKFLDDLGYPKPLAKGFITGGYQPVDTGARTDIIQLFEHGAGNNMPGVARTAWALLNGVTEYVDHHRATRIQGGSTSSQEARLSSAWFQHGRDIKVKALELALAI